MAGSLKYFVYTTDLGNDFAIKLDESNTEAVNAGTQDYPDTGVSIQYEVPRNVTPRTLVFRSLDNRITRKVVALTQTIFAAVGGGSNFVDPVSGVTVYLTLKEGERLTIPKGQDTGLNDGDAT